MKLYLLETYDQNMQYDDGIIVALTPEVCYHLDKRGIEYSIIEDYYNEHELCSNRQDFLDSQSEWFEIFDNFLKNNVDVLKMYDLNLASMHTVHLKVRIIDPIIYKSYTLKELFIHLNPSSVTFLAQVQTNKVLNNGMGYIDKSIYGHLIPIICKKHSIPFTEQFGKSTSIIGKKHSAIHKILSGTRYIHHLFEMLRSIFRNVDTESRLNILQLNLAYNGFDVLNNAFIRGHNSYLFTNNKIVKFHRFGLKIFNLNSENSGEHTFDNWNQIAQLLESHTIIDWINKKCSLDVSDIVLPKLKYFVSEICPETLSYYNIFIKFYESTAMDVVLSPYMQSTVELAAVAAANKHKGTKTICVEHGDDLLINLPWRMIELTNFDILIVSTDENKQYLESICNKYSIQTKIYSCLNRTLNMSKIKKLRETKRFKNKNKKNENEIIYLPTLLTWDTLWIIHDMHITPTKYYQCQKEFLEYFSKKNDYTFIWKALFASEPLYNPIPDVIRDNEINNVKIATDPFQNYLPYASRIICDYPSTGMYESVIAGVPTMCLCSNALTMRESGVNEFKNIIRFYSNRNQIISHIEQYISSNPKQYTTSIKINEMGLIDIIELECGI